MRRARSPALAQPPAPISARSGPSAPRRTMRGLRASSTMSSSSAVATSSRSASGLKARATATKPNTKGGCGGRTTPSGVAYQKRPSELTAIAAGLP